MHRPAFRAAIAVGLALALGDTVPGNAATPSVLLREGDLSEDGVETIDSFQAVSVNGTGGYAVSPRWLVPFDRHYQGIWGSLAGGPPGWITPLGPGSELNTPFCLTDDGGIAWVAYDGAVATVWMDDTELTPLGGFCGPVFPGGKWERGADVRVARETGQVFFFAWTVLLLGSPCLGQEQFGIFEGGNPTTPLVLGQQAVPGVGTVQCDRYSWDHTVSEAGTHSFVSAPIGPAANALLLDGNALILDGNPVVVSGSVSPGIGGKPGETWTSPFSGLRVNEQNDLLFTNVTSWNSSTTQVLVHNGSIRYRAGESLVDGEVLTGTIPPRGTALNSSGDVAVLWEVGAAPDQVLIVNDHIVARTGDPVDLDGDGNADAGVALGYVPDGLVTLRPYLPLELSERDPQGNLRAYFIAGVDTAGTLGNPYDDLNAFLTVPVESAPTSVTPAAIPAASLRGAPNPFVHATALRFSLPRGAETRLSVHDVTGRLVTTLREGWLAAGAHRAEWDGTDEAGAPVPAGVYFCRLRAGEVMETRKLVRVSAP